MFIKDVLHSFRDTGKIEFRLPVDEVKDLVYTSMFRINRFNGITKENLNLIDHNMFVSDYAMDLYTVYESGRKDLNYYLVGLMGLTHDLGESIIGDITYSIKKNLAGYKDLELIEAEFIRAFMKYCFKFTMPLRGEIYDKYVKKADDDAGLLELFGVSKFDKFVTSDFFFHMIQKYREKNIENALVSKGIPILDVYQQVYNKRIENFVFDIEFVQKKEKNAN